MIAPVIIITTGRSGSSAFGAVLQELGAWLGHCFVGENGKQHYENSWFLEANRRILDMDKHAYAPTDIDAILNKYLAADAVEHLRVEAHRATVEQDMPEGAVWVLKNPRVSVTWPVWLSVWPQAKWIIFERDHESVCRGFNEDSRAFMDFRVQSIGAAKQILPKDRRLDVHYDELGADFDGTARRIAAFCGLGDVTEKLGAARTLWRPS